MNDRQPGLPNPEPQGYRHDPQPSKDDIRRGKPNDWCRDADGNLEPWTAHAQDWLEHTLQPNESSYWSPTERCLYRWLVASRSTYTYCGRRHDRNGRLARALGTTKSEIRSALRRLEDNGWIECAASARLNFRPFSRYEYAENQGCADWRKHTKTRRDLACKRLAKWAGVEATPAGPGRLDVSISVEAAEKLAKACEASKTVLGWLEASARSRSGEVRDEVTGPCFVSEAVQDLRDALGNIFDVETPLV